MEKTQQEKVVQKSKRVSIVGGGLVGALQACYLQKRGYNVDVYESRGDPRKAGFVGGRSINLAVSVRGWTALEKVGLKQQIQKIGIPMYGRSIHMRTGEVSYQPYGKSNQCIYAISRGELNKKMIELADSFENVNFHFNRLCQNVNYFKSPSEIQFLNLQTNERQNVKSNFIIGSDGAFSKIRQSILWTPRFQYQQTYINYGYKELSIPPGPNGQHLIHKNSLHFWPRGEFMMIALPNLDGGFTCTLFLPFQGEMGFSGLNSQVQIRQYFEKNFPDALKIMPTLVKDFMNNPISSLITVKCKPWHYKQTLLIGDAAHALLPFFGQGMNCGFEDVRILDELFDKHNQDGLSSQSYQKLESIFKQFSQIRKQNADSISQMAWNNFIQTRDKVGNPQFLRMKHIQHQILESENYKDYTSMYQYVSFSNQDYSRAQKIGKKQYAMLEEMLKDQNIQHKIKNNQIGDYLEKYLK